MKCYKISVFGMFFDYYFTTFDDISKKEIKEWFKKNYTAWRLMTIKQIDESDVDPLWAIHLYKDNDEIKCV